MVQLLADRKSTLFFTWVIARFIKVFIFLKNPAIKILFPQEPCIFRNPEVLVNNSYKESQNKVIAFRATLEATQFNLLILQMRKQIISVSTFQLLCTAGYIFSPWVIKAMRKKICGKLSMSYCNSVMGTSVYFILWESSYDLLTLSL